jgi:hypothetical protein
MAAFLRGVRVGHTLEEVRFQFSRRSTEVFDQPHFGLLITARQSPEEYTPNHFLRLAELQASRRAESPPVLRPETVTASAPRRPSHFAAQSATSAAIRSKDAQEVREVFARDHDHS